MTEAKVQGVKATILPRKRGVDLWHEIFPIYAYFLREKTLAKIVAHYARVLLTVPETELTLDDRLHPESNKPQQQTLTVNTWII